MSTNDKKCVVCNAYLFEEDDVVHCPTCGAPHHRSCYNSLGHCGLEEFHGTNKQYTDKKEEQATDSSDTLDSVCNFCGKELLEGSAFCPHCGSPRGASFSFNKFNNTVHIDSNAEIAEGVTLKELSPVVLTNQVRYFSRFLKTSEKGSFSWNWAAFLFPHAWFAFRKMYSFSWVFSLLMIMSSSLTLPFNLAITRLPGYVDLKGGSAVLGRFVFENVDKLDSLVIILAAIGSILHIAIMLLGGLLGDRIYKKHAINVVKEIRSASDKPTALRKKGGISLFGFILSTLAVSYLPGLLFSLI